MLTVHHLDNSRSLRILWLLEELGCPYEIVAYRRDPQTMLAPPELLKIHPLGKSPVLVDGARTIAESGAIIEYLVDTYGQGRLVPPAGSEARLRYTYWLHYAEGSAMPLLLFKLVFQRLPSNTPLLIRPIAWAIARQAQKRLIDPQLARHAAFWAQALDSAPWFAGPEFSAADIQMSFPLEAAAARLKLPANHRVRDFVARIQARPAYRRAIERGGALTILR